MKQWVAIASLTGALLVAAALAPWAAAPPDFASVQVQPYTPPKPAPAFALPDLAGKTVTLADLRHTTEEMSVPTSGIAWLDLTPCPPSREEGGTHR